MNINCVDAKNGKSIFNCGVEGVMPTPNAGDIVVTPDRQQFRVLQRAYIAKELKPDGKTVPIGTHSLDFEIQCACCPVGEEADYAGKE